MAGVDEKGEPQQAKGFDWEDAEEPATKRSPEPRQRAQGTAKTSEAEAPAEAADSDEDYDLEYEAPAAASAGDDDFQVVDEDDVVTASEEAQPEHRSVGKHVDRAASRVSDRSAERVTAKMSATRPPPPPRPRRETQENAPVSPPRAAPPSLDAEQAPAAPPDAVDRAAITRPARPVASAARKARAARSSAQSSSARAQSSSEFGPSIDEDPGAGPVRRVRQELKRLEGRFVSRGAGDGDSQRNRIPLEMVWRRWRALAMRDRSEVVDEFGRDPHVAASVDPLLDFFYRSYFRVGIEGMENIPDTGRGLIVANHSGTLPYDGAMIMHAIKKDHPAHREVRPLVEDFVFHFPYLGTLMNRIGGVRACQENAQRLLENDHLVAVFPEGIKGIGKLYAQRYQLQRFGRGGFIKLALATNSPIIPTAVVGAEEIHPMLSKVTFLAKAVGIPYLPITPTFPWLGPLGIVPLPTKWMLAFGEPLYFNAEYGAEAANDRILVNKLGEQVRQKIQDMIDGLLATRRSVLFG